LTSRTARTNARTLRGSFLPFVSTPLRTSTAYGRIVRTQAPTLSGVKPPLTGELARGFPTERLAAAAAAAVGPRSVEQPRRVMERPGERIELRRVGRAVGAHVIGLEVRAGGEGFARFGRLVAVELRDGTHLERLVDERRRRIDEHGDERGERGNELRDLVEPFDADAPVGAFGEDDADGVGPRVERDLDVGHAGAAADLHARANRARRA